MVHRHKKLPMDTTSGISSIFISLTKDSTIRSSVQGKFLFKRVSQDETVFVTLYDRLFANHVNMSLLSAPYLIKKGLVVMFVPKKAFIFNMNDQKSIILLS